MRMVVDRGWDMSIEARLPFWIKAGFTGGQIAGQVLRDIPSLLLLFYLTSVIGMEPAIAGTTIFVPKLVFGVLFDMGIGIASDRFVARFPRRRWLLIGAAIAPLALILLFQVPTASTAVQAGYVFLVISLYMLGFSAASVPYLAQYSEITDSPRERTVLMAWRHGFTPLDRLRFGLAHPGARGAQDAARRPAGTGGGVRL
jgi:GPH family glycoside/pentoside/hexuronide:cation symporter